MATRAEGIAQNRSAAASALGFAAARVVVPLWLLIGAVLKLVDGSPSHLPASLIKLFGALGIDLAFVLELSIAVELTVVGVMWLLPRLARPVGLALLGVFFPVLVADVVMGSASCGCFGAVQVHPAITATVDLTLLAALWLLAGKVPSLAASASQPTGRVVAAGLWTIAGFALAFGLTGGGATADGKVATEPETASRPADGYYLPDLGGWVGRRWTDLDIATWVRNAPAGLDAESGYVLFYRKDCEHCHELMEAYFSGSPLLPTTAVAVPEREGFPAIDLGMPCGACRQAELPAGVDWFLQTPVLVRLDSGVVVCAAETTAEDPKCMG